MYIYLFFSAIDGKAPTCPTPPTAFRRAEKGGRVEGWKGGMTISYPKVFDTYWLLAIYVRRIHKGV